MGILKAAICAVVVVFAVFGRTQSQVRTGLDVLADSGYDLLEGKSVGLLTNYTAVNLCGVPTAELFAASRKFSLKAIFTPEHGFYANHSAGDHVGDEFLFDTPVYSLYGQNRKPSPKQLSGCDIIVVDLQDIGIRSYTYISSMVKMMEACAGLDIPVVVLDRPNPIGGNIVDGCTVAEGFESFVGIIPVAYIHGCTIGEIARMTNDEGWLPESNGKPLRCFLTVIKMQNWDRTMRWEDTGLQWLPTSPNIPTPDAVRGAAMLGAFGELGQIGIGIGTAMPFQYLGRVNFDIDMVRSELKAVCLDGVMLHPVLFRSSAVKSQAKTMKGFLLTFPASSNFAPFSAGVEVFLAIRRVHPEVFDRNAISDQAGKMFAKVCGSADLLNAFLKKASDDYIRKVARKGVANYLKIRQRYLMY